MLDSSFERNAEDALGLSNEPLLSDDQARGLRVLFGTLLEYRHIDVRVRRENGADLIYPELGPWIGRSNTFYKTWEARAAHLALHALRVSYGGRLTVLGSMSR